MSADKYRSIFSRQMEAIVYIQLRYLESKHRYLTEIISFIDKRVPPAAESATIFEQSLGFFVQFDKF